MSHSTVRTFGVARLLVAFLVFTGTLRTVQAADVPSGVRGADGPTRVSLPGIENGFRVTERIYSGSQPEGDAAFQALRKLGVKTILSVDGTPPDVERAARYGLRYVHVPHGYDGISSNTAMRLAKAATVLPEPIFVHCHHGKHRGPAAVGIMCRATAGWSTNQVVAWMKLAGTSADYSGLYRDNLAFEVPTATTLQGVSADFPSRARLSGLVDAMVEVDRRWDHLMLIQKAGWKVPASHPDLVPADEALLLAEAFRELKRSVATQSKGEEFLRALATSDEVSTELHGVLKAGRTTLEQEPMRRADELLKSLGARCTACHKKFRN